MNTITIGCPISNRAYLINEYLNGIYHLNYPKDKIKLYFVVNNSHDSTESDLKDFKRKHDNEYLEIKIERYKISYAKEARIRKIRLKTYSRLAELRNYVLSNIDTDYFFSVDSDIILDSECLNKLLNAKKDIIAAVINNDQILKPNDKYPEIRTNLLIDKEMDGKNIITHYLDFPLNEIIEVGYTGAVYLLTNEVCKNIRYGFHEQGEDMYFCTLARENGYKIYAHTGIFLKHIMRKYQEYCIENKCQRPCVCMSKELYTYQYEFLDNKKYAELIMCGKCIKGTQDMDAIFNNNHYNPLDDMEIESVG